MKKILFIIIICFMMIMFSNCGNNPNTLIYSTQNWVVKYVNDSVLICIPISDSYKPYLVNVNTFANSNVDINDINNIEDNIENLDE
ncbi:hypothetical protein IKN40_01760 [bacterium]|nr:hypothetical protein [bacterium]